MEKLTPNTTITLNNGVKMPIFGYSLENIGKKSYNIKTQTELLLDAIRIGYRFFDTCEDHGGLYACYPEKQYCAQRVLYFIQNADR